MRTRQPAVCEKCEAAKQREAARPEKCRVAKLLCARQAQFVQIQDKEKSMANPDEEADQGDGRNAVKDEQTPLKEHGARDGDDAGKDRVVQKRRRTFDSHEDIGVT